jgi:hypothetical protein
MMDFFKCPSRNDSRSTALAAQSSPCLRNNHPASQRRDLRRICREGRHWLGNREKDDNEFIHQTCVSQVLTDSLWSSPVLYGLPWGDIMFSGFFIVLVLLLGIYFLPWIVALARNAPRTTAIFVLNLLLGWTLIGWVIALVWAFAEMPRTAPQNITVNAQVPSAAPAVQPSSPKTIVVTAVATAPSLASALLEQPALLVRQEQDGQVQWRVDAESGPVGRVEGEDAARIEFNANAVGRPRAVFRTVAPQLTLGITFGV